MQAQLKHGLAGVLFGNQRALTRMSLHERGAAIQALLPDGVAVEISTKFRLVLQRARPSVYCSAGTEVIAC